MYKIVKQYIDKLNVLVENTNQYFLDEASREECIQIRTNALDYLNSIFKEYNWSEEFVISFAVYCNFFILQGLHKNFDFDLNRVYDTNEMDADDRQYLEYIHHGILEQNIKYFESAVDMNLYDFDIPKYYIYLLSFLELCLREEDDFATAEGKEDIFYWYCTMENSSKELSSDLIELIEPKELSIEEEAKINSDYSILLPRIIISSTMRKLSLAAISDLNVLSELSGKKIKTIDDIIDGYVNVMKNANDNKEKMMQYLFFANEFIKRTRNASEIGDQAAYDGKTEELRDAEPICRREFLNLPVTVSEKQYRNIALAQQVKLNFEKEKLIQKNEEMVEDYSHSVENIIKPALISEVAKCLREDEKNRNLYNKIMYVYFNEIITQNECRLLKMVHNISISKGTVRESISKAKLVNGTNGIALRKLVCKAINQISLQLAEDSQKARFMFIMDKMRQAGIDSELISNRLWDSSENYEAVYDLYNEKLNFTINISEQLKNVVLNEEELGTSFLYTRIVELISNALTYGEYMKNRKFNFDIYLEETDFSDKYIVIEMANIIGDRSFSNNRNGNGLNATVTMLDRINFENPEKDCFVISEETEQGLYVTRLYIDADLYM